MFEESEERGEHTEMEAGAESKEIDRINSRNMLREGEWTFLEPLSHRGADAAQDRDMSISAHGRAAKSMDGQSLKSPARAREQEPSSGGTTATDCHAIGGKDRWPLLVIHLAGQVQRVHHTRRVCDWRVVIGSCL